MQFTINIPDAQVQRVADMVRSKLPLEDENNQPINYSNAELLTEFKRQVRQWIKGEVQQYELLLEHEASFQAYTQIDVTDV